MLASAHSKTTAPHATRTLKWLTASLLAAALAACGSGEGAGAVSPGEGVNPNVGGGGTTITELEGSWLKSCRQTVGTDPTDSDAQFQTATLVFSAADFSSTIKRFSDSQCATALEQDDTATASGTFVIGSSFTSAGGAAVKAIDLSVDTSNGANFSAVDYTIFRIDGSILFFGRDTSGKDGSSAATRNDTLDAGNPLNKQASE